MYLDARTLPGGATLEADLCIIGAGPTGLTLASELAHSEMSILVVESAGFETDPAAQRLNLAVITGDAYEGLQKSRHRQVGGTARIWNTPLASGVGAKYVPLDPVDFRGACGRPHWPIQFDEIEPYYRRAQSVAGIGPFAYEAEAWTLPPSPIPNDHPLLASRIYQFGSAARFCDHLPNKIVRSSNITLCSGATVHTFTWAGHRINSAEAAVWGANRITIRSKTFVLASGGVENARMLLLEADAARIEDQSGCLGRGFMEHPRDYAIKIETTSRKLFDRLAFFDTHVRESTTVCGRIALREEAIMAHNLPNASITFLPAGPVLRPFHWRLEALARRRFGINLQWPPGYGWSRIPSVARFFDGFQLLINLEEFPYSENRLSLDTEHDQIGMRRVRLHRRWHPSEAARLSRLKELIVEKLAELGLGTVKIVSTARPDPNSHHHLGATRMGTDPKEGVTDSFGQVFGTGNLFVAGGSLFPASGYANPTLTSIALAIRLADRLRAIA